MTYRCKHTCGRWRAPHHQLRESRYENGQKYCSVCCEYLLWDGVYCPCCGAKLRFGPRLTRTKSEERWLRAY